MIRRAHVTIVAQTAVTDTPGPAESVTVEARYLREAAELARDRVGRAGDLQQIGIRTDRQGAAVGRFRGGGARYDVRWLN